MQSACRRCLARRALRADGPCQEGGLLCKPHKYSTKRALPAAQQECAHLAPPALTATADIQLSVTSSTFDGVKGTSTSAGNAITATFRADGLDLDLSRSVFKNAAANGKPLVCGNGQQGDPATAKAGGARGIGPLAPGTDCSWEMPPVPI